MPTWKDDVGEMLSARSACGKPKPRGRQVGRLLFTGSAADPQHGGLRGRFLPFCYPHPGSVMSWLCNPAQPSWTPPFSTSGQHTAALASIA